MRVLYFDGVGLWVCARRMEGGRLRWPQGDTGKVQLSQAEFAMLLGGIDLRQTKARKWYRRPLAEEPEELLKTA
jgi:transposase